MPQFGIPITEAWIRMWPEAGWSALGQGLCKASQGQEVEGNPQPENMYNVFTKI